MGRRPRRDALRAARSDQRRQLQHSSKSPGGSRPTTSARVPTSTCRPPADGERPCCTSPPDRAANAVAVDAATGEMLWMHRLEEGRARRQRRRAGCRAAASATGPTARATSGSSTSRSATSWSASTRRPGCRCSDFGINGVVDLKQDNDQQLDLVDERRRLERRAGRRAATSSSSARRTAPARAPRSKENAKGYIRGYDARTGKRLWIFHTIPRPGEFGNDTWLNDSWSYTGHTGVWTQMTVDEELGIAYLPVEIPTGDYFGGHRPGNNLFAESLVALEPRDRQAALALPVRPPPDLGLRRAVRADPRRHHRQRQGDQGGRAADQAGLRSTCSIA